MSNKAYSSTQKSYYLPGDPSRTPLTHEEFCDIMRPFWKQRKQLQRAGDDTGDDFGVILLSHIFQSS